MKFSLKNLMAALLLAAACAGIAAAQRVTRPVTYRPFEPAEELVFEAELSRSLLRKIDVADFRLKAQRTSQTKSADSSTQSGTQADTLVLTCDISSKGFFPRLFGLRFRELLSPQSTQSRSRCKSPSGRMNTVSASVRARPSLIRRTEKFPGPSVDPKDPTRPPRVVTSEFTGSVHDILSAIYFLRTQPLQVGKNFELPISDSGQVYKVPVRVLEKKRMKTVVGRVDALLIEAELFGQRGMIEGEGKFFMWLTDDARRIPVSVKIKSEYGTFDIKLKKFTHTPGSRQYLTQQD